MNVHAVLAPFTVTLALIAPVSAQTRTVPNNRANLEGFSTSAYPWSYSEVRFQQILLSSQVATSVAAINGVAFRRDGQNVTNFNAKTWAYTVTMYETSVSPATMTTTWATNRGATNGTIVFNGMLNIPASAPVGQTPAPFVHRVALNAPFIYATANGHLLLEVEGFDTGNLLDSWASDGESIWTATRGDTTRVTQPCFGLGQEVVYLSINATSVLVGGSMTVTPARTSLLTFANWIGLNNTDWNSISLPFDLTGVGAPGCVLGTGMLAIQAGAGPFNWPIPNDMSLENAVIFTQGLGIAPNANAANLVMSDTYQVRIGGPTPPAPVFQSVFRRSGMSMTDGSMSTTAFYGAIVQLDGVFN